MPGLRATRFPGRTEYRELRDSLLARPNVEGVFVGRKRRAGRLTGTLSLVCCVRDKVGDGRLAAGERVPDRMAWSAGGDAEAELPTDVQVLGKTEPAAPVVAGPGDKMADPEATIGLVVNHPSFGKVVTTAGHAFQEGGGTRDYEDPPEIVLHNAHPGAGRSTFRGRLLRSAVRGRADYALIRPDPEIEPRNLFQDRYLVWDLYVPHPSDVGTELFVLTDRGFGRTQLHGLRAEFDLGGVRRRDALLTKYVTSGGDSGCCLIDRDFRVWGLLLGFAQLDGVQHSVFQSPRWLLAFEQAEIS